jgi:cysteate synthase
MGKYELICLEDGARVKENYTLSCEMKHKGLLRAEYAKKQLNPKPCKGMFKFYDWLPVKSTIATDSAPVVFRNEKLSRELGLDNLWIGFSGYYPERNAVMKSCTFKEMEALPTYARLNDNGGGTIVLASAGNTARAFAQVAAESSNECVIVVPRKSGDRISVTDDRGGVRMFTVDGDYTDAIRIADRITSFGGFVPEGGARNVARRDGMGVVMLQGALDMGRIPDHYFQAVGSGTGGISAWEASMRLIGDGRYGDRLPVLNLAQNKPFTPMAKAWNAGRRDISDSDLGDAKKDVAEVYADMLTNRKPPYSMTGGVFDAMTACNGRFSEISNGEARSAEKLWLSYENAVPDPAASVAFASLIKAAESEIVKRGDVIFLNMTGGGLDRAREDFQMVNIAAEADLPADIDDSELRSEIFV